MAIDIGPIAKPQIHLEGERIDIETGQITTWSERVDIARNEAVTSMTEIQGVTNFDQTNIITFDKKVRIIITGQIDKKFGYFTKTATLPLADNIFEGKGLELGALPYSNNPVPDAGKFADTYFTINGKDPVRTKAYLYKYKDLDDHINDEDPLTGIGFILGTAQTGSDLITIKARTYWAGNKSRIAIARFKIHRQTDSLEVENGVPIESV